MASTARTAPATPTPTAPTATSSTAAAATTSSPATTRPILRTGSTAGPRFRVLTGSELMNILGGYANVAGSEYDGTTPCEWFDPNGLVAGSCRTYGYQQDPRGTKQRFVQLYDMDGSTARDVLRLRPRRRRRTTTSSSASSATTGSRVTPRSIDDLGQVTVNVLTRDTGVRRHGSRTRTTRARGPTATTTSRATAATTRSGAASARTTSSVAAARCSASDRRLGAAQRHRRDLRRRRPPRSA